MRPYFLFFGGNVACGWGAPLDSHDDFFLPIPTLDIAPETRPKPKRKDHLNQQNEQFATKNTPNRKGKDRPNQPSSFYVYLSFREFLLNLIIEASWIPKLWQGLDQLCQK